MVFMRVKMVLDRMCSNNVSGILEKCLFGGKICGLFVSCISCIIFVVSGMVLSSIRFSAIG